MMSSIYDDIGNDKMKLTQNYEHYRFELLIMPS